ncbi:LytR/AlgR family response regulator transcription factor [Biformimicrobium ophioploci]|uniref:LytTR family DNA-binding domain-containing protein n=1 Tax=Biformimicrobium ophioploci TaxID=3036711 RepID=A0ABQ6M0Y7_9GAMM|nr:LytTR family DNA-binding domain-containing protein [Microbulbifer sp. NKW57]GMG87950.1 LytTR family DNA-binding domain-containing protein [Microbulbifer sp. NKW57]
MSRLKAVLVDDEPLALRLLQSILEEISDIEVVATGRNGREALSAVVKHTPDILFLDVQMPGMNGFEVVRRLQGDTIPLVIFTTAFDEYAIEAFEVHAVDYVLKPLENERLALAIERARGRLPNPGAAQAGDALQNEKARLVASIEALNEPQGTASASPPGGAAAGKLAVKDRGKITMLNQADVEWIDAAGDYMCVHARGTTHIMRSTMKELEQQLCSETFKRVHRSTLVNLNYIEQITTLTKGEFLLTLSSGAEVKVSRNYRKPIKEYLDFRKTSTAN